MQIDVVITCGPNDYDTLPFCVASVRRNVQDVARIVIVAPRSDIVPPGCEFVDEKSAGFPPVEEIEARIPVPRNKWYLQQLIKLYVQRVVEPHLSDYVLIVDADVVFLKPVQMVDEAGRALHNTSNQYHFPYFAHMARLLPGLHRVQPSSGITHHMVFQRRVLDDLFNRIETHHSKAFWQAFIDCVNPAHYNGAGASEYEIYHNFALLHHPETICLRPLPFINKREEADEPKVYVCIHYYYRTENWKQWLCDQGFDM
jgi:hypothetical protein